jgi:hypothetical protein
MIPQGGIITVESPKFYWRVGVPLFFVGGWVRSVSARCRRRCGGTFCRFRRLRRLAVVGAVVVAERMCGREGVHRCPH